MGRNLGKLGESILRGWGAEVGLVVNSSEDHDAAGWDFILEWPNEHHGSPASTLPLDLRPSPLQCLVQVKSTDSRRQRWSVKLSNWWRFVTHPTPTFYLVLEFDSTNQCQRAFLVHVGESYIGRALKRMRELTVQDADPKLYEHTMDFTFGRENEISPNGIGLMSAIEAHTGNGLEEYIARKQRFLAKIGYDDVGRKLRVKPRIPDGWSGTPDELLVDFGLGLVPHLEIETGEIVDVRFGIPAVLPEPLPNATLRIVEHGPVGKGGIQLRAPHSGQQLLINAEVYVPHGILVSDALQGSLRNPIHRPDIWFL